MAMRRNRLKAKKRNYTVSPVYRQTPSIEYVVRVGTKPILVLEHNPKRYAAMLTNAGVRPIALALTPRVFGNCSQYLEGNRGRLVLSPDTVPLNAKSGIWAVSASGETKLYVCEYVYAPQQRRM